MAAINLLRLEAKALIYCPQCDGTGRAPIDGVHARPCPLCRAVTHRPRSTPPCARCVGNGRIAVEETSLSEQMHRFGGWKICRVEACSVCEGLGYDVTTAIEGPMEPRRFPDRLRVPLTPLYTQTKSAIEAFAAMVLAQVNEDIESRDEVLSVLAVAPPQLATKLLAQDARL